MQIVKKGNRKAISPVLATVILIAITLIAAIAIAGFVFGLFGSFTTSAQVSAQTVSCTGGAPLVCSVRLSNTGTSNTANILDAASITYSGITRTTVVSAVVTITAGTVQTVSLSFTGAPAGTSGSQFSGSIPLTNGASVPFTGTFP